MKCSSADDRARARVREALEVVRAHRDERIELGARAAEEATLSQARHGLHPTEGLFDELAFTLREPVGRVAPRAPIESRDRASIFDESDVRADAPAAQRRDECFGAVTLVAREGLDAPVLAARDLTQGGGALPGEDVIEGEVHDQPTAVLGDRANVGAFHLNLWMMTLTELWAWDQPDDVLVDRSDRPWDHKPRRPSHADRRKSLLRHVLQEEFRSLPQTGPGSRLIRRAYKRLLALAA